MAVGITTAVCLGLTIFALQTKWDFTILRGLMLCLLISLIFFGILAGSLSYRAADVAYAWLGAAIFSIYLVIDFYSTNKCHDFERMSTCFIPFDRPWRALQLCFWVCCDLMKRLIGNWRKLLARESHLAGAGAISRFCGRTFDQIIFHSKDFW